MRFMQGLKASIAGLILFAIAGILFGAAQYTAPILAELFFWLAVIGLIVAFVAPAYYWVGEPVWRRVRGRAKA